MVVPFSVGGGADIVGRAIAQKLAEGFAQHVIVDNRPGAAGNIGTELVAHSPADGYTLLLAGPNLTTNIHLFRKLAFDPVKDFEPISLLTAAPYILVAHPSLPPQTVRELIAFARPRPDEITYGSAGNGTAGHLAMELIKSAAKIEMVHVPYKGSPPLLTDLIGGQISLAFDNVLSATQYVRTGRLHAMATSGAKRTPVLPEVPTVAESGLPGFEVTVWQGMLAPARTSRETLARLYGEILNGLHKPDVRERMAVLGVEIIASTPEEFGAFIRRDIERWAKVIRASGARLD